jgi:hypothetical protein
MRVCRSGRFIALLTGVSLIAALCVLLARLGVLDTANDAIGLVAGLTGVAACCGALWRWLLRGPRTAATPPEQVDSARAALAGAVLARWRAEAALRHPGDPLPVAVCWGPTSLPGAAPHDGPPLAGPGAQAAVPAERLLAAPQRWLVVLLPLPGRDPEGPRAGRWPPEQTTPGQASGSHVR